MSGADNELSGIQSRAGDLVGDGLMEGAASEGWVGGEEAERGRTTRATFKSSGLVYVESVLPKDPGGGGRLPRLALAPGRIFQAIKEGGIKIKLRMGKSFAPVLRSAFF